MCTRSHSQRNRFDIPTRFDVLTERDAHTNNNRQHNKRYIKCYVEAKQSISFTLIWMSFSVVFVRLLMLVCVLCVYRLIGTFAAVLWLWYSTKCVLPHTVYNSYWIRCPCPCLCTCKGLRMSLCVESHFYSSKVKFTIIIS